MRLDTKPKPIEVDLGKSAVVVVDMQNAFASRGGMLDLAGLDISDAPRVVAQIRSVLDAARAAGVAVVHLQVGYKPDLSNAGGPGCPNWHKELALRMMQERQPLRGKLLIEGTWDYAIVEELAPQPGELVVKKTHYSGFARTRLEEELRSRGIEYLFFAGIATNVCVESTLRHAYMLDFWPILIADAAMPAGPREMHEATVFNVESFFGWTIPAEELVNSLAAGRGRSSALIGG
jgi:ureidoacrylate peracid hydrolase